MSDESSYTIEEWRRCAEQLVRDAASLARAYTEALARAEEADRRSFQGVMQLELHRKMVDFLERTIGDVAEALGHHRDLPRASGWAIVRQLAADAPCDWIGRLTNEQLQSAESACACWATREVAAEALRCALLMLAQGKEVDRRAVEAAMKARICPKCDGRGYVQEDPDQPECDRCGNSGLVDAVKASPR